MSMTVYFDLETAGLEPHHPNIQLAAIAVDDATGEELATFEKKIAFDMAAADMEALAMNHYKPELWDNALSPRETAKSFASFLRPFTCVRKMSGNGNPYYVAKLAGHFAAQFDGPRLQALFKEHALFLPAEYAVRCTMQRALWWFDETGKPPPVNFKLTTLCSYFQIPITTAHEALADVRLTIALARALSRGQT